MHFKRWQPSEIVFRKTFVQKSAKSCHTLQTEINIFVSLTSIIIKSVLLMNQIFFHMICFRIAFSGCIRLHHMLLLLLIWFSAGNVISQPTFNRIYGTMDNDAGISITRCSSGGYLVTGTTMNYYYGDPEIYLVRISEYGDTLWTRTYQHPFIYDANVMVYEHTDQTCLLGNNFYGTTSTVQLQKYSETGNEIWSKTFEYTDGAYFSSVCSATDTGIVICGSHGASFQSVFLIKTDNSGGEVWRRSYGGSYLIGYSGDRIRNTIDNGYIVSGYARIGETELYNGLLIKTDSSGIATWVKQYESPTCYRRYFSDIQQDADGSFYITGYDCWDDYFFSPLYPFLMKTDESGNVSWVKYYDQNNPFGSLFITDSGNLLLASTFSDTTTIAQVNPEGDITWSVNMVSAFEGSNLNQVIPAADGGYIITGSSGSSGGYGGSDVLVMKANSYGIITEREPDPRQESEISVSPNPFTDKIQIRSTLPVSSVSVYNIHGACMFRRDFPVSQSEYTIAADILPGGLYIVNVHSKGRIYTKKIIKY